MDENDQRDSQKSLVILNSKKAFVVSLRDHSVTAPHYNNQNNNYELAQTQNKKKNQEHFNFKRSKTEEMSQKQNTVVLTAEYVVLGLKFDPRVTKCVSH